MPGICFNFTNSCTDVHSYLETNISAGCVNHVCKFAYGECGLQNITICEENQYGLELNDSFATLVGSLILLIMIIAVIANLTLISTIIGVRQLHSVTHAFIVNLAVGDLITAILTLPFEFELMWWGSFRHGRILCGVSIVSFFLSLPSSITNLCLLTVERYVTIKWPFNRIFKTNHVIVLLLLSWTYSFLLAVYPIMSNPQSLQVVDGLCDIRPMPMGYAMYLLIVTFLLPILVIIILNLQIFRIASRHYRKIAKSQVYGLTGQSPSSSVSVTTQTSSTAVRTDSQRRRFGANIKAAKRIFLLVGVFVICWLTFFITVSHNISCKGCHPREMTWMVNVINYSNIAINPILYGLLNKKIRSEFCNRILKMKKWRSRTSQSSSTSNRSNSNTRNTSISSSRNILDVVNRTARNNNTDIRNTSVSTYVSDSSDVANRTVRKTSSWTITVSNSSDNTLDVENRTVTDVATTNDSDATERLTSGRRNGSFIGSDTEDLVEESTML